MILVSLVNLSELCMARITVEDCLEKVDNRFALVILTSRRVKNLLKGAEPLVKGNKSNKPVVTALREIASGFVAFLTPEEEIEYQKECLREEQERKEEQEIMDRMNTTVVPFRGNQRLPSLSDEVEQRSSTSSEEDLFPSLFTKNFSLDVKGSNQEISDDLEDKDEDLDDK